MDDLQKIQRMRTILQRATEARVKAHAILETQKITVERVEEEVRSLGIKPTELLQEIDRLGEETAQLLSEAEALIPKEYRV